MVIKKRLTREELLEFLIYQLSLPETIKSALKTSQPKFQVEELRFKKAKAKLRSRSRSRGRMMI